MHRVCSNCGTTQGPFESIRLFKGPVAAWICTAKSNKEKEVRQHECFERRNKADHLLGTEGDMRTTLLSDLDV